MSEFDINDGEGHGNAAFFRLSLGFPIPDGKGGTIKANELHPIEVSGLQNRLKTFKTPDGREHSGGIVEAADFTMVFLNNNQVQNGVLALLYAATIAGLPAKGPCTLQTLHTDKSVAETWEIEEVLMKGYDGPALNKETPTATRSTVTCSAYNARLIPV